MDRGCSTQTMNRTFAMHVAGPSSVSIFRTQCRVFLIPDPVAQDTPYCRIIASINMTLVHVVGAFIAIPSRVFYWAPQFAFCHSLPGEWELLYSKPRRASTHTHAPFARSSLGFCGGEADLTLILSVSRPRCPNCHPWVATKHTSNIRATRFLASGVVPSDL